MSHELPQAYPKYHQSYKTKALIHQFTISCYSVLNIKVAGHVKERSTWCYHRISGAAAMAHTFKTRVIKYEERTTVEWQEITESPEANIRRWKKQKTGTYANSM
jgi:hypothetical protein